MKSDDFNSAAIDVVADVRPERVITDSQSHRPYPISTVSFLSFYYVFLTAAFLLVGCSIRRQWFCRFRYMQGCGIQRHRGHWCKQVLAILLFFSI